VTQQGADPPAVWRARPHVRVTDEGRTVREVLSYTRRSGSMSAQQAQAWARRSGEWWIPDSVGDSVADSASTAGFDVHECFGGQAPLVVEIGSGIGEATTALAAARPSYNVLAFEVWRPGIAQTFQRLEAVGADNVRMVSVDAAWWMEHLLASASVRELWTFFPDPWPKRRHHRRRLVNPEFARMAAGRLEPEGRWRLATDWPEYAEHMAAVLDAEPLLHGGVVERWADRPVTRYERRGIRAGHPVTDLSYTRR